MSSRSSQPSPSPTESGPETGSDFNPSPSPAPVTKSKSKKVNTNRASSGVTKSIKSTSTSTFDSQTRGRKRAASTVDSDKDDEMDSEDDKPIIKKPKTGQTMIKGAAVKSGMHGEGGAGSGKEGGWNAADNKKLFEAKYKVDSSQSWDDIAALFPGRKVGSIKMHFARHIKKKVNELF